MTIVKRPIVTEKTIKEYKKENKVVFEVSLDATKTQVEKVIESTYGVTVVSSWVHNRLGKKKTNWSTRKVVQKTRDAKIVVLKLKEGDKIKIFDQ